MKFTTFAAAPSGEDIVGFQAWFHDQFGARFVEAATGLTAAVMRFSREAPGIATPPRGDPDDPAHRPVHAVLESWFVTSEDFRRTAQKAERILREHGVHFVSYRVTAMLEKDPRFAEAGSQGSRPAFTYVTPVRWLQGLASGEARRHWDEHISTALRVHATLTKYERNWVDEVMSWSEGATPVDGYADFSFRALEDWASFFPDADAVLEIRQDVANFIKSGSGIFLTDATRLYG